MSAEKSTSSCTMFHDGACPFCRREVEFLRQRDPDERIRLVDISDPSFDAEKWGVDREQLMAEIHGLDEEGRLIRGPEVFRRAYRSIGLGWIWSWTAWPIVRPIVDLLYLLFAKLRVPLGRLLGGHR